MAKDWRAREQRKAAYDLQFEEDARNAAIKEQEHDDRFSEIKERLESLGLDPIRLRDYWAGLPGSFSRW